MAGHRQCSSLASIDGKLLVELVYQFGVSKVMKEVGSYKLIRDTFKSYKAGLTTYFQGHFKKHFGDFSCTQTRMLLDYFGKHPKEETTAFVENL